MNIIKVDAQTGHEELLSINEFITECPDISTSPFWAGNLNKTRTKRKVHGKDDRIKVSPNSFPYSAIVALEIYRERKSEGGRPGYGSGAMLGPDVMLTAAHCFYDLKSKKTVAECRVHTYQNSKNYDSDFVYPKYWYISDEYKKGNKAYDWCVAVLQKPIGQQTGWFGKVSYQGDMPSIQVTVSGYPGEDSKRGYQYRASGKITSSTDYQFNYALDTSPGQSGSPVYNDKNQVVGVHTYGGTNPNNTGNRLTNGLYQLLQKEYEEGVKRWK